MSTHDWLKLIEISGPFVTEPVLRDVFENGLNVVEAHQRRRLRSTYAEWERCVDEEAPDLMEIHQAWIEEVLAGALGFDERVLRSGEAMPDRLKLTLSEHGLTLSADWALVDRSGGDDGLFLISSVGPGVDFDEKTLEDGYAATPLERMVTLLRGVGLPLGLVANGERWCLVHAPEGEPVGYASWYARLWFLEPVTLQAFVSLMEMPRFFSRGDTSLAGLYKKSKRHQDEVTEALGDQVARAVEVLIQSLDRADEDRKRELLHDVEPEELYEAGLTVMMRLVFLMAAEERGLLLLGDPRYDAHYAVSNLRARLVKSDEGVLATKYEAWAQLLALFRMVYGGIEHPVLRLPALGGSLFDPDRFPFLEGRNKMGSWREETAEPLPIDDRTVLLLLNAIQLFEGRTLSYRALDVEQIGHVYEGLLEKTVKRIETITLDLVGTASANDTVIPLDELEAAAEKGRDDLIIVIKAKTRKSESAIGNALDKNVGDGLSGRLSMACHGDLELKARALPFVHLLETDPWGDPIVHPAGAFVVGLGQDRRQSGSHYTPKALTERIVEETLEPIVYIGPRDGAPKSDWRLRPATELLDLKVCDPAMGSGAFLVQVCRSLSDRLVEAWERGEVAGLRFDDMGRLMEPGTDADTQNPLPKSTVDRADLARRLIAEKCLYGVDINPLAVELAKLSIWLVTMSKGRPFGFLDHNFRHGNSLLGIWKLEQLIEFDLETSAGTQGRLFGRNIREAIDRALELRERIRSTPIRDIHDVDTMAALDNEARRSLDLPILLADAFVGIELAETNARRKNERLNVLSSTAELLANGDIREASRIRSEALEDLAKDEPRGIPRSPFHWPLEFPEVFSVDRGGFDAFVGNPPFLGGKRIREAFGVAFRNWLVGAIAEGVKGSADLVAYFFLRVFDLLSAQGSFGLLAVNTISEGDTRQVGLERMLKMDGTIYAAYPNEVWPGSAAVVTSRVHMAIGDWRGERKILDKRVSFISAFLSDREEWSPKSLSENAKIGFIGSLVHGTGFVLESERALRMLDADPRNADVLFPYINGQDLNSHSEQKASRWCINFWDWPVEHAKQYEKPFQHIVEYAKPVRLALSETDSSARRYRKFWWLHGRDGKALYHAIGRGENFDNHPREWKGADHPLLDPVFVAVQTGKYLSISHQPNDIVFSHMTIVFANNDPALFAQLNSTFHYNWVHQYSAKMKNDLRYLPTDCFENFPLTSMTEELRDFGGRYHDTRRNMMRELDLGLTKSMNVFHDQSRNEPGVASFREFQILTDQAVLDAYDWTDLILDHDFRTVEYLPENDNVRFTISDELRREVLHRLALLNKERWLEEGNQDDGY
jgi:hypothetical protein